MGNAVVSLDIGSSKVCVLIAEMNKKQFNIMGVGTAECRGVKKGIIVDIDATVDSIKAAAKQAEQMSNKEIKSVFVNIAGGHTSISKNRGVIAVSRDDKEITSDDVKRAMQAAKVMAVPPDKEIIDIIPEQFIVDGYDEIRDPIGMIGVRLEVDANIVTASCTNVQNIIRCVQRSGLGIDGIVIEPLGTSSVILNNDEKELGVALVDVGAETTDISIFKKGSLVFTKLIPVGGNHITNDISIVCKISSADSEKIKKHYGVASSDMIKNDDVVKINNIAGKGEKEIHLYDVAQIMEARINEMLMLIRKQLEDSGMMDSLSAGIVITGGGLFNIKGIQEIAQSYFDIPIRLGYPNYIGVANPIYSAAAGTAMYVLKNKKTSSVANKDISKSANKNVNKNIESEPEDDEDFDDEMDSDDDEPKLKWFEKVKEFFSDFF